METPGSAFSECRGSARHVRCAARDRPVCRPCDNAVGRGSPKSARAQVVLAACIPFGLLSGHLAVRHRTMARWNTVGGLAVPSLLLVSSSTWSHSAVVCPLPPPRPLTSPFPCLDPDQSNPADKRTRGPPWPVIPVLSPHAPLARESSLGGPHCAVHSVPKTCRHLFLSFVFPPLLRSALSS